MQTENLTNIIINKTCNGQCSCCGECCADILPIDNNEINIIKQYIRKNSIKECIHAPIIDKRLDLTCPFRDNLNKKCTIYPVRPAICKSFICSKPVPNIEKEKELFHRQKKAQSMRNVFFNGPELSEIYEKILLNYIESIK